MKDKDFGFVVVILVAIFFSKEIKGFVAKRLGKEEPTVVVPNNYLGRLPDNEWLTPRVGESMGLLNPERQGGSQAARLLEELSKPAEQSGDAKTGALSYPLFPRKQPSFSELLTAPAAGRLDSAGPSSEALTKSEPPDGGT
jgi:hypothetical protein